MSEYTDLMRQLDRFDRQLLATGAHDFARRYELSAECDRLRGLIRDLVGEAYLTDDRPTEIIEREIAALTSNAAAIRATRINLAAQAGRSSSIGDVGETIGLNQKINEAAGYAALQQRIGQLETILEQRSAPQEC